MTKREYSSRILENVTTSLYRATVIVYSYFDLFHICVYGSIISYELCLSLVCCLIYSQPIVLIPYFIAQFIFTLF